MWFLSTSSNQGFSSELSVSQHAAAGLCAGCMRPNAGHSPSAPFSPVTLVWQVDEAHFTEVFSAPSGLAKGNYLLYSAHHMIASSALLQTLLHSLIAVALIVAPFKNTCALIHLCMNETLNVENRVHESTLHEHSLSSSLLRTLSLKQTLQVKLLCGNTPA